MGRVREVGCGNNDDGGGGREIRDAGEKTKGRVVKCWERVAGERRKGGRNDGCTRVKEKEVVKRKNMNPGEGE